MPNKKVKDIPLEKRLSSKHTVTARIWQDDRDRAKEIKKDKGFTSIANVLRHFLRLGEVRLPTFEGVMKTKEKEEMARRVPILLTGLSYSGKSDWIRRILLPMLASLMIPVFLIDITGKDYPRLEPLGDFGKIYSIDFENSVGHIRFIPMKGFQTHQIESLFNFLLTKSGSLSRWVIIVEDAHGFKDVASLRHFLYSSRHYVRKMIVVTPDEDAFRGLETFKVIKES